MKIKSALAVGLAITLAAPALAVTSISGSMNLTVFASIANGTKTASDSANDSFTGAPAVMGVFAVATATDGNTGGLLTAIGQGISSGTANAGSIHFQAYGWTFGAPDAADHGQMVLLNDHSNGPDWSYTFKADHAGTIDLSYDVFLTAGKGSAFGLQGWSIGWTGAGGGALPGGTAYDPTANGIFSRALVAGETYTISLFNAANVSTTQSFQPGDDPLARMSGTFVYNITDTVPEPATWAMLVGGFGFVGMAKRRRTRQLAA